LKVVAKSDSTQAAKNVEKVSDRCNQGWKEENNVGVVVPCVFGHQQQPF
jgi:hypothetical protein